MSLELPVIQPLSSPEQAGFLVEVAFKGVRRGFYTSPDVTLRAGEWVVVEVERGRDLGRVRSVGGVARSKCGSDPARATPIVRRAELAETHQLATLRADEERVRRKTREMVEAQGLKMKVSDAEWQWDRN